MDKDLKKVCKWVDRTTGKHCTNIVKDTNSDYCDKHTKLIMEYNSALILKCSDCPVGTPERCQYFNPRGFCFFEQLALDKINYEDIADVSNEWKWVLHNLRILLDRQFRLATKDGIVDEKTFKLSQHYAELMEKLLELISTYAGAGIQNKEEIRKKLKEVLDIELTQ